MTKHILVLMIQFLFFLESVAKTSRPLSSCERYSRCRARLSKLQWACLEQPRNVIQENCKTETLFRELWSSSLKHERNIIACLEKHRNMTNENGKCDSSYFPRRPTQCFVSLMKQRQKCEKLEKCCPAAKTCMKDVFSRDSSKDFFSKRRELVKTIQICRDDIRRTIPTETAETNILHSLSLIRNSEKVIQFFQIATASTERKRHSNQVSKKTAKTREAEKKMSTFSGSATVAPKSLRNSIEKVADRNVTTLPTNPTTTSLKKKKNMKRVNVKDLLSTRKLINNLKKDNSRRREQRLLRMVFQRMLSNQANGDNSTIRRPWSNKRQIASKPARKHAIVRQRKIATRKQSGKHKTNQISLDDTKTLESRNNTLMEKTQGHQFKKYPSMKEPKLLSSGFSGGHQSRTAPEEIAPVEDPFSHSAIVSTESTPGSPASPNDDPLVGFVEEDQLQPAAEHELHQIRERNLTDYLFLGKTEMKENESEHMTESILMPLQRTTLAPQIEAKKISSTTSSPLESTRKRSMKQNFGSILGKRGRPIYRVDSFTADHIKEKSAARARGGKLWTIKRKSELVKRNKSLKTRKHSKKFYMRRYQHKLKHPEKGMSHCEVFHSCISLLFHEERNCEQKDREGRLMPGLPRRRNAQCNFQLVPKYQELDVFQRKLQTQFIGCIGEKTQNSSAQAVKGDCAGPIPPMFFYNKSMRCPEKLRVLKNHCDRLKACCPIAESCHNTMESTDLAKKIKTQRKSLSQKAAQCQIESNLRYRILMKADINGTHIDFPIVSGSTSLGRKQRKNPSLN